MAEETTAGELIWGTSAEHSLAGRIRRAARAMPSSDNLNTALVHVAYQYIPKHPRGRWRNLRRRTVENETFRCLSLTNAKKMPSGIDANHGARNKENAFALGNEDQLVRARAMLEDRRVANAARSYMPKQKTCHRDQQPSDRLLGIAKAIQRLTLA